MDGNISSNIENYLNKYECAVVALSGGVDSAVMLLLAKKFCKKVFAVFVKSEFQPQFELDDAFEVCSNLGVDLNVLNISVLNDKNITLNPSNRCYYCKKLIMSAVKKFAEKNNCDIIFDGTNASDDIEERAGYLSLKELGILSPLRICNVDKNQVRAIAKENGLHIYGKPSYACLATRIPGYMHITDTLLRKTECAENELFSSGFTDFRIRYENETSAKVQLSEEDMKLYHSNEKILNVLYKYYNKITVEER